MKRLWAEEQTTNVEICPHGLLQGELSSGYKTNLWFPWRREKKRSYSHSTLRHSFKNKFTIRLQMLHHTIYFWAFIVGACLKYSISCCCGYQVQYIMFCFFTKYAALRSKSMILLKMTYLAINNNHPNTPLLVFKTHSFCCLYVSMAPDNWT